MQPGRTSGGVVRYYILAMLFIATTVNYADRATLSIAGPQVQAQLGLSAVAMGYLFSAFGWAYVAAQIPGGWLLDRFGSRRVYAVSLLLWSLFTALQGMAGWLAPAAALVALCILRLLVGLAEAPAFPGNSRICAAWFPTQERGTAAAVFNAAQYCATVIFTPLMSWITHRFGWTYMFYFMGVVGVVLCAAWLRMMHGPRQHAKLSSTELEYIAAGGALVDLDNDAVKAPRQPLQWRQLRQLLGSRMLLGVYLGQYCITTLTYFFLTWFPIYLVRERGMTILQAGLVASLPAICGLVGGILGGMFSDALLKRGWSLTAARKIPIVAGLLLSTTMIGCNYIQADWLVILFMSVAFFGKGVGALGWAVVSDTSPRQMTGVSGAVFNTFGNVAAITTPIAIGYIVQATGSFTGALVFVGANALVAMISYLVIVGPISRLELQA